MSAIPMTIVKGSLATPTCWPATPQEFLNQLVASGFSVNFSVDSSLFNYGNTIPNVDQQIFPWLRVNDDGSEDRWYTYWDGSWKSPHWFMPGIQINYVDPATGLPAEITEADAKLLDGGNANPLSLTDGPFWQIVPASYDGRFPVNLARTNYSAAQIPFSPAGKKGPEFSAPETADAVAAGLTGATIPGASGTYNGAEFPRYIVSQGIYRTSRRYYEII